MRYHCLVTRRRPFNGTEASASLVRAIAAGVASVAFLVLGVVVWHKWGPGPSGRVCDASRCFQLRPSHREHPLRAEALWAMSGLSALIALTWAARILIGRRGRARPGGLGRV